MNQEWTQMDTNSRMRTKTVPPLRVGVGGPVGTGKTTLVEMLCKAMRDNYDIVVITNDIYTKEDQRLLTIAGALPADRILGVETGGCPHTAIREDASINLEAIGKNPSKRRSGNHSIRPSRHQQDRPGSLCWRFSRTDGCGCAEDARRTPICND